ncbi:nitrogen regulation protein NR(II) [Chloroflexota bacterium]
MKDIQTYPFSSSRQNDNLGLSDYAALMELMPHPALLVDSDSGQILIGNTLTGELSAYTRKEITGLLLTTLLPEWDQASFLAQAKLPDNSIQTESVESTSTLHLVKRDQTRMIVAATCITTDEHGKRYFVGLQPYGQWGHPRQSHHIRFWEYIKRLVNLQPALNLNGTLEQILETGGLLTSSNILAVYSVSDQKPILTKIAGFGAHRLLPEQLPIAELMSLGQPQIWSLGTRSSSTLQRAARKGSMTYLACAPIGQPNSSIGLMVVADTQAALPDDTLHLTDLLATIAGSTIQRYTQVKNTHKEIETQASHVQTASILEERMHEGIFYLDQRLNIIKINMAAELMLGYTGYEVVGQPVDKVLIGTQSLQPALEQAQSGSPTYNLENVRLYRRNGDAFLALVRIFPVQVGDSVEKMIVFIQDLSEQEKVHRQAQEFEQRAVLGDVTAVFAHEVRNPINNISTGLQLMALTLDEGDPNHETIDRMLQDCDRMAALMKSVQAFSRPVDYEMEALDLPTIIRRLLDRLKARITRLNIQFEIHSDPDCPPVEGNLRALEQVFTNLIQNALDAMADTSGRLGIKIGTVSAPGNRQQVQVSIADTGPGIPTELQEKIFQPFVTTKKEGTGLGLAIAKQIITAHKGDLRLTSFPGGTLFQVHLPAANPAQT